MYTFVLIVRQCSASMCMGIPVLHLRITCVCAYASMRLQAGVYIESLREDGRACCHWVAHQHQML